MRVRSIGFLLVLVSVAVFAGPAQSDSSIECGSSLTESVTLDHDIGPCPQGALEVVGDDVTIDLNGHTITGSGGGTGVLITTPADGTAVNVSVTNGSVSGFGIGVGILVARPESGCGAAGKIAVENVGIRANQTGVSIFGFPGCPTAITLSRDNIMGNAGDGVTAAIVGPVSVLKSHIAKNGGVGIRAAFDSVRLIDGNLVAHNGADGVARRRQRRLNHEQPDVSERRRGPVDSRHDLRSDSALCRCRQRRRRERPRRHDRWLVP